MERERECRNLVHKRQLCIEDVGFVTWRSSSYILLTCKEVWMLFFGILIIKRDDICEGNTKELKGKNWKYIAKTMSANVFDFQCFFFRINNL